MVKKLTLMTVEHMGEEHLMAMEADTLKWVGTLGPAAEHGGRMNVTATGYTTAEVAALVEEIKAKTYDGVKARVLSLLEALLQVKGMGDSSAGRVLDILLKDVDRLILDIAAKHVPEITPALLEERRREREDAAERMTLNGIEERINSLRAQADAYERQMERRNADRLRSQVNRNLQDAESATLDTVPERARPMRIW